MSNIVIGSRGLCNADIILVQHCSLSFDVIHKDADGNIIDHSNSNFAFAFQGAKTHDMSEYVNGDSTGIHVSIPAKASEKLPIGSMFYDLIVTTDVYTQCLLYGNVQIGDSVSLDERR